MHTYGKWRAGDGVNITQHTAAERLAVKFMMASGRRQTIKLSFLQRFEVWLCAHICTATAEREVKQLISQVPRVLTSMLGSPVKES